MTPVITVVGATLLLTVVHKFTDVLKYITNKDWNGFVTTVATWGLGIAAVFTLAATQFANTVQLTDTMSLGVADGWTKILAGIMLASGGSTVYDFKNAFDNTATAVTPPLLNKSVPPYSGPPPAG